MIRKIDKEKGILDSSYRHHNVCFEKNKIRKCEIEQLKDTTLSSAWTKAMSKGQQPSAPEDYIEVEQ